MALTRSRHALAGDQYATSIQADLRYPDAAFDDPQVHRLPDLTAPIAVLMLGVLHDIPDADDPPPSPIACARPRPVAFQAVRTRPGRQERWCAAWRWLWRPWPSRAVGTAATVEPAAAPDVSAVAANAAAILSAHMGRPK